MMEHFIFKAKFSGEDDTWIATWYSLDGGIIAEATSWVGLYSEVDDLIRLHLGLYPFTATFADFSFDIVPK